MGYVPEYIETGAHTDICLEYIDVKEYFPDLKSVKLFAESMQTQRDNTQRYNGLVPKTEEELPEARKQLGAYMRTVWKDEIAALEIELALDEDNYYKLLSAYTSSEMFNNDDKQT